MGCVWVWGIEYDALSTGSGDPICYCAMCCDAGAVTTVETPWIGFDRQILECAEKLTTRATSIESTPYRSPLRINDTHTIRCVITDLVVVVYSTTSNLLRQDRRAAPASSTQKPKRPHGPPHAPIQFHSKAVRLRLPPALQMLRSKHPSKSHGPMQMLELASTCLWPSSIFAFPLWGRGPSVM